MLYKATTDDIHFIYKLGQTYDENFSKKFNIEKYIDDPNYIVLCYQNFGFIIATNLYGVIEILLVVVSLEQRKKGIASLLLKELEKNADKIILEVSKENIVALNLYKKLGYIKIGERKKYYNGIDALIMEKVLK